MAGLVASLGLVLLLVKLPLYPPAGYVVWYPVQDRDRLTLESLEPEDARPSADGMPITRFDVPGDEPADEGPDAPSGTASGAPDEAARVPTPDLPERLIGQRVLDFAETMPAIEGGLRSYYLHIEYPDEARTAGIQGRLVLEFIVETDGRTSNIRVLQTLHPLCDSAAVRALRTTRFIPGEQNGVKARVRMRLPVRFQLVGPGRDRSPSSEAVGVL